MTSYRKATQTLSDSVVVLALSAGGCLELFIVYFRATSPA